MSVRVSVHLAFILLAGLLGGFFFAGPAVALPDGFAEAKVADVPAPVALDFTPDGRMLVTSKPGQLYVVDNGQESVALNLAAEVCSGSERGLLGVAVDPDFGEAGRNHVYLYYTYEKFDDCPTNSDLEPVNRVSRFTMSGNTVDPASERVLLDNIPSPNGNHNGGDLKFGKGDLLYVSVGDGGCDYAAGEETECAGDNDASRDRNVVLGKVLRIRRDGGIPSSNPYTGEGSGRCNQTGRTAGGNNCRETFSRGFRNPFRMAVDPDAAGTTLRVNDVGQNDWEEVDRARAGADYGWNICEGSYENPYDPDIEKKCPNTYTGPIHEYNHNSGCTSITGGAFVPDGFWPTSYDKAYLYGDYVCNKIFKLTPRSGGGFSKTLFAGGLGDGGPISTEFGPYGAAGRALYYTNLSSGQVRRIAYSAANRAPVATADTAGENYDASLTMDFDASGSRDPDGDTPLTYNWFFGDGSEPLETADPTISHTYGETGKFDVTLTVEDNLGKQSAPDTIEVFPGNTPPTPMIESPSVGETFRVGQPFTATGSVTDAEDDADEDAVTAPTLYWEVRRYHDNSHYHPWASDTDGDVAFEGPPPEDLEATDPSENYLQMRLTATDSLGLSKTVTRRLEPKTVDLRFQTGPLGLDVQVNGLTFGAPKALASWEGYALNVDVKRQRDASGRLWVFDRWSDGRAKAHTIKTPGVSTTYTAYLGRI